MRAGQDLDISPYGGDPCWIQTRDHGHQQDRHPRDHPTVVVRELGFRTAARGEQEQPDQLFKSV
jgi:hypothetical protein